MRSNNLSRYGSAVITLHWLMVALVIAVYVCIELREFYPKGSMTREALKTWHYIFGLSVFGLVWLRLIARLSGQVPAILPAPPPWQVRAATIVEVAIYAFTIAMPVLGWLILNSEGKSVPFFSDWLPHLIGENKAVADRLQDVHEFVGNVGYGLIGIHVLAALYHHYVQRDNTLRRMLPGRT